MGLGVLAEADLDDRQGLVEGLERPGLVERLLVLCEEPGFGLWATRKDAVLAAKAVETQGKGAAFAAKAVWKHQAKAVSYLCQRTMHHRDLGVVFRVDLGQAHDGLPGIVGPGWHVPPGIRRRHQVVVGIIDQRVLGP